MRIPFFRRQPSEPVQFLVVGLGNPGPEYADTRHNVGFVVVDRLARRHGIEVQRVVRRALFGSGRFGEVPVGLAKPITYMNLSGESVEPLRQMHGLEPGRVIVVTDDLELPVGRIRVRPRGSAGGHNGLKSLIHSLGTEEFPRVRVGVGRPPAGVATVDYVLGRFDRAEETLVEAALDRAAEAVEGIVAEGIEAAMNRFNRAPASPP